MRGVKQIAGSTSSKRSQTAKLLSECRPTPVSSRGASLRRRLTRNVGRIEATRPSRLTRTVKWEDPDSRLHTKTSQW